VLGSRAVASVDLRGQFLGKPLAEPVHFRVRQRPQTLDTLAGHCDHVVLVRLRLVDERRDERPVGDIARGGHDDADDQEIACGQSDYCRSWSCSASESRR